MYRPGSNTGPRVLQMVLHGYWRGRGVVDFREALKCRGKV